METPLTPEAANVWWYVTDARPTVRHYRHGAQDTDVCTEAEAREVIAIELVCSRESTEGLRVWPFRREQDTVQEVPHASR